MESQGYGVVSQCRRRDALNRAHLKTPPGLARSGVTRAKLRRHLGPRTEEDCPFGNPAPHVFQRRPRRVVGRHNGCLELSQPALPSSAAGRPKRRHCSSHAWKAKSAANLNILVSRSWRNGRRQTASTPTRLKRSCHVRVVRLSAAMRGACARTCESPE